MTSVHPGVQRVIPMNSDGSLDATMAALLVVVGAVTASPTANTVNDRLKALATAHTALAALVGEVAASPTANTLQDRLKTLATGHTTQIASLAQAAKPFKGEYETVAASQTAQVLGPTGAAGDYIKGVLVIPATTAPGAIALLDNATSITIYTGGTVGADLTPFFLPLDMVSVSGAWKLTTGANVSCIAVGDFT